MGLYGRHPVISQFSGNDMTPEITRSVQDIHGSLYRCCRGLHVRCLRMMMAVASRGKIAEETLGGQKLWHDDGYIASIFV